MESKYKGAAKQTLLSQAPIFHFLSFHFEIFVISIIKDRVLLKMYVFNVRTMLLKRSNTKINQCKQSVIFEQGMIFLHDSDLEYHGNLKSSNCVITSRWVLQLTDFGLSELRTLANLGAFDPAIKHPYYQNQLWKAPEHLQEKEGVFSASQKGDVYAFGIILYEIYGRKGPYGLCEYDPQGKSSC